jgi:hypothetical protein
VANKLAGQRAKFSRARAIFYTTADNTQRQRAIQLMAEVLANAPAIGLSEEELTQGAEVPKEVRQLAKGPVGGASQAAEDDEQLVAALGTAVDASDVREVGEGTEFVYAYGYGCAPDWLKIGSTTGDVMTRIAAQIGTGTPDKPRLRLTIRTHDCRALEKALHSILRFKGRQVAGAGAEWFIASQEEVLDLYERIDS